MRPSRAAIRRPPRQFREPKPDPMHPHLSTLYNLQLADNHIVAAKKEIESLDWGDAQQKAINALRSEAARLIAEKTNAEKTLKQAESDLAATEARIKRSQRRVEKNEIHNEHELESTEKELVTMRARQSELEEQALTLMDGLEQFKPKATEIVKKEQALVKELAFIRSRSTERKAKLVAEIEAVSIRRAKLASELPPALSQKYEHLRQHRSGIGVVRVVSGSCDSCHVVVPGYEISAIIDGNDLVGCEGCGRLLYTETRV